jgi:hypothetical protein
MNEELSRVLDGAQNSDSHSSSLFCFIDESGAPTPLLVSFVYGLLKADPNQASVDAIVLQRLAKVAGGANGNPGLLTEVVRSMVDEGIIVVDNAGITVYSDRFLSWMAMGEADTMVLPVSIDFSHLLSRERCSSTSSTSARRGSAHISLLQIFSIRICSDRISLPPSVRSRSRVSSTFRRLMTQGGGMSVYRWILS